jgi:NADPH-dependent curcumin reductase CurA
LVYEEDIAEGIAYAPGTTATVHEGVNLGRKLIYVGRPAGQHAGSQLAG